MFFHYTLLYLAVTAFVYSTAQENAKGERELRKALFQNYDKYARPVKKHTTAVPVAVSLDPVRLNHLDERNKLINLDSWVMMTWKDEYLTWNPAEYDNITELHVPPSEIWRPDIALYTATPDKSLFPTVQTEAILYNNGTLIWVPPFTINSRCPMSPRAYNAPTKTSVECNIRMGSWTYSEKMLDLQLGSDEVDLSSFEDSNPDWKLVKVDSGREAKVYPCCPDAYPAVDFNVTFKSRIDFARSRMYDRMIPSTFIENMHILHDPEDK